MNYLFIADHDWPVFSILLDRQIVPFPGLIDLKSHGVCEAEWSPNGGHPMSEVSHQEMDNGT